MSVYLSVLVSANVHVTSYCQNTHLHSTTSHLLPISRVRPPQDTLQQAIPDIMFECNWPDLVACVSAGVGGEGVMVDLKADIESLKGENAGKMHACALLELPAFVVQRHWQGHE